MLAAGTLRQRVTLRRVVNEKDDRGQDVQTSTVIGKPWASVNMIAGGEKISEHAVNANARWMVKIRWRPDLRATDLIEYDDGYTTHTLNIVSIVDSYERREQLEIVCGEDDA